MSQESFKKKNVLVCGHDLKFWRPLQTHLAQTQLFTFKEDIWSGHNQHNPQTTLELMAWADIIIAEWMLGNAVFCSQHLQPHQRLIIRLHLQERNTPFPAKVCYDKVQHIVFVGPHILKECVAKFPVPGSKALVIANLVDFAHFNIPKHNGSNFNLGLLGILPSRKRLDLALDILEKLLERDERYILHIKGYSPQNVEWLWARTQERAYYKNMFQRINNGPLRYRVIIDPPGNDVRYWFQKIGWILSPSDFESFHMAVAEGMCSGTIPVIRNWEGAESIYPHLELFKTPAQAAHIIDRLQNSTSHPVLATQVQNFVKKNFDVDAICRQWINILTSSPNEFSNNVISRRHPMLLVVYAIDTWETFHRREMLEALAYHCRDFADLLIIEPGTHYTTLKDKNIATIEELNNFCRLIPTRKTENIYTLRIIHEGVPPETQLHSALKQASGFSEAVSAAIQTIFGRFRIVLHWLYKPNQYPLIPSRQPFFYEVYDEYTMNFATGDPILEIATLEPDVLEKAEHVFFTSDVLAQRKQRYCRSWSIIENGVHFDAFTDWHIPMQCRSSPRQRKCVGYLGNLSDFFDWKSMYGIVTAMPNVDFFFHGQIERHRLEAVQQWVEALEALPNTFFSGRVSRTAGSAAINRYDALIIPFVINDAMHAVNPLKLWEYFATGKPVVSSPMLAISLPDQLLYIAHTQEQWIDYLSKALNEANPQLQEARRYLAKEHAWDTLTLAHTEILREFLFKDKSYRSKVYAGHA